VQGTRHGADALEGVAPPESSIPGKDRQLSYGSAGRWSKRRKGGSLIGDLCPGFISLTPLKPDAPQAARNLANRPSQYNPTAPWTVKWLRNYHQYNPGRRD